MQDPFSAHSDAVWQRQVVLLPVSDQRAAVDLAADALLHHLPPVELQARVHRVYALSGQVPFCGGLGRGAWPVSLRCLGEGVMRPPMTKAYRQEAQVFSVWVVGAQAVL